MHLLEPQSRRWTKTEYYAMAFMGWFNGQRVELMEGEVVVLSPQSFSRGASTDKAGETIRRAFGTRFWVRTQLPMDFGLSTEPEPDVSVVQGRREDHAAHPKAAILLVEASESSLEYDRGRKGSLYAAARVPEYWILNLIDRQLEVYRSPVPDPAEPSGFRYADKRVLKSAETVTPLALPGTAIAVADLLV
jgi:Uma2 family endonuclease